MYPCFVYADDATSAFPEDVQQFEKAVLDRSSRSRSQNTAKLAAEDDSEKDKGSDSEDEDEDEPPKKRPVSPYYVLICCVASIMIHETRSDQCKEKYYGFFARSI